MCFGGAMMPFMMDGIDESYRTHLDHTPSEPPPTLKRARTRVGMVADGRTINGTYGMMPIDALEAFKADLRAILAALP